MSADEAADTGIIDRIHAAFNRRDLDAIADELTEDVVFHQVSGVEGTPPTMHGRGQVMRSFEMMMKLGDLRIEHHNAEVLAGHVVGVGTVTVTLADGDERSFRIIDVCRLRDGRLAERWAMFDRPQEAERVLAEASAA